MPVEFDTGSQIPPTDLIQKARNRLPGFLRLQETLSVIETGIESGAIEFPTPERSIKTVLHKRSFQIAWGKHKADAWAALEEKLEHFLDKHTDPDVARQAMCKMYLKMANLILPSIANGDFDAVADAFVEAENRINFLRVPPQYLPPDLTELWRAS